MDTSSCPIRVLSGSLTRQDVDSARAKSLYQSWLTTEPETKVEVSEYIYNNRDDKELDLALCLTIGSPSRNACTCSFITYAIRIIIGGHLTAVSPSSHTDYP